MGFLQICSGVVLLQLSKSAKDVPDTAIFKGDLDQVRTVAEQEEPESEPKADAIRGAAAIIRRLSNSRQKNEAAEAKRVHDEKLKDQMEPIAENERVEWDGLRRRKTIVSGPGHLERRKTLHPPLGMTHFPEEDAREESWSPNDTDVHGGFPGRLMNSFRRRAHSSLFSRSPAPGGRRSDDGVSPFTIPLPAYGANDPPTNQPASQALETKQGSHVFGLPQPLHRSDGDEAADSGHSLHTEQHGKPITWAESVDLEEARPRSSLAPNPPPHGAKRQFSFQNVFHRHRNDTSTDSGYSVRPSSRIGLGSRQGSHDRNKSSISKSATEEERLGLVKGDSASMLVLPEATSSDDEIWHLDGKHKDRKRSSAPSLLEEKELEDALVPRQPKDQSTNLSEPSDQTTPGIRRVGRDESEERRNFKKLEGRPGGGAFI